MDLTVVCMDSAAATLGEGPCWSGAEGRLYWFDIKRSRLHWLEFADGRTGAIPLEFRASAAAVRRGGLLVATERGLMGFDSASERLEPYALLDLGQGFRSNDGQ